MELKKIDGLDKIFISDAGDVYSFRLREPKRLTISNVDGYPAVKINSNGKIKTYYIHRLLAIAFIPNPDPDNFTVVNHIDGNRANFKFDNLEWTNQSENIKHAWRTDLRTTKRKLTQRQIQNIRKNYVRGCNIYGTSGLAKKYGITRQYINHILKTGGGNNE